MNHRSSTIVLTLSLLVLLNLQCGRDESPKNVMAETECRSYNIQVEGATVSTWHVCDYVDETTELPEARPPAGPVLSMTLKLEPISGSQRLEPDFTKVFPVSSPTLTSLGDHIVTARDHANVFALVEAALILAHYERAFETEGQSVIAADLLEEAAELFLQRKKIKRDPIAVEAIWSAVQSIGESVGTRAFTEAYGFAETVVPEPEQEIALGFAGDGESAYTNRLAKRKAEVEGSKKISKWRKMRAKRQIDKISEFFASENPKPEIADEVLKQLRAWIRSGADPGSARIKKVEYILSSGSSYGFAGDSQEATLPYAEPSFVEITNQSEQQLSVIIDGSYYGGVAPGERVGLVVPVGPSQLQVSGIGGSRASLQHDFGLSGLLKLQVQN